jgi:hypothetical protein
MVPLLLHVPSSLGLTAPDMRQVAGMTMVQVFAAALLGYVAHRRRLASSPRLVAWMGSGMMLGAAAGGVASKAASLVVLEGSFALMATVAAPLLFVDPPADEAGERPARAFSPALAFASALAVGVLSGLVGVGGAFLLLPLMIYGFGVPTRVAVGTSLGIITLAGLAGVLAKLETGQVPLGWAAALCAGALPGVWVGARVSQRLPARRLRLALAVLVAATATRMLLGLPAAARGAH